MSLASYFRGGLKRRWRPAFLGVAALMGLLAGQGVRRRIKRMVRAQGIAARCSASNPSKNTSFVGLMYHHFRRFHEHLRAGPHSGVTTSHHVPS
jgi:hypothetical protein